MTTRDRLPALTASTLLHGGLVALAFLALPKPTLPPILRNEAVPVTVVDSAPVPDVRPAVKAPEPAPAASPEPAPTPEPPAPAKVEAPPAPPPPAPKPTPAPAKATPPQKAAPIAKTTPAPAAKAVAKPKPQDLDLSQLAASLPKSAKAKPQSLDLGAIAATSPSKAHASRSLDLDALASTLPAGAKHGAAVKGAARPETAAQSRPAVGAATALSGDVKGALAAKLIRLWNLECSVPGSDTIVARVNIRIGTDGALTGAPTLVSVSGEAADSVKQAAAGRAISAVSRGAPYTEVPAAQRKVLNNFTFNFDAKQACR